MSDQSDGSGQSVHGAPDDAHGAPDDAHGAPDDAHSPGAPADRTGQETPKPGPTGSPAVQRIEDAVTGLAGLEERPLDEHPAAYESVHRVLREALSDLES